MTVYTKSQERAGLSRSQIAALVGALLLIVSFFLPWANTGAGSPSGLAVAQNPAALAALGAVNTTLPDGSTNAFLAAINSSIFGLLYLVPLIGVVIAGLSFVRQSFTGSAIAGLALLAFLVVALFYLLLNNTATIATILGANGWPLSYYGLGLWMAMLGAIIAIYGGFGLWREHARPGAALTTDRIATAGMLGAIAVALAVTRLGFFPVPNATGSATIMHLPVIVGAVLQGPVVGLIVGLVFGVFSLLQDTTGLFVNPLVSVFPRLLIGPIAWLAFRAVAGANRDAAAITAGVIGTLTNTVGVVGMIILLGLLPAAIIPAILPQAIFELVLAAIITPLVVRGVSLARSGRTTAEESGPREKQYF
jgi:uncharacterized membrane protein